MDLILATNNNHKIEEVKALLPVIYKLLSLKDIGCNEDIEETADTFEGNALLKARYLYEKYHLPCFSDDSGLEVMELNWAPGVFSARYAGEHGNHEKNMDKLLQSLDGKTNRAARFRTVLCYIDTNGNETYFNGIINGTITHEKRGSGGFGYDPLFIPDGYQKTFAEMNPEEKNLISHRALAVKEFAAFLSR